jgi:hypothetical protein
MRSTVIAANVNWDTEEDSARRISTSVPPTPATTMECALTQSATTHVAASPVGMENAARLMWMNVVIILAIPEALVKMMFLDLSVAVLQAMEAQLASRRSTNAMLIPVSMEESAMTWSAPINVHVHLASQGSIVKSILTIVPTSLAGMEVVVLILLTISSVYVSHHIVGKLARVRWTLALTIPVSMELLALHMVTTNSSLALAPWGSKARDVSWT